MLYHFIWVSARYPYIIFTNGYVLPEVSFIPMALGVVEKFFQGEVLFNETFVQGDFCPMHRFAKLLVIRILISI